MRTYYYIVSYKTKIWQICAGTLIASAVLAYLSAPHALASFENIQPLVFEVKSEPSLLSYEELAKNDPLVDAVRTYLVERKSPLADFAADIVLQPRWEMAMAVIAVESTHCRFAANFNCGSVGVGPRHPQWRKFTNAGDGFAATAQLLNKPLYKDRFNTCEKMRMVYVVPGSNRWVNGCKKVLNDMVVLGQEAETKRLNLAINNNNLYVATAVVPTLLAEK